MATDELTAEQVAESREMLNSSRERALCAWKE